MARLGATGRPNPSGGHLMRKTDLTLRISGGDLGIPLRVAGFLAEAIGSAYPNTMICDSEGEHQFVFRIPAEDYLHTTNPDLSELLPKTDDPQLVMFVTAVQEGRFGVAPPPWLGQLVARAAAMLESVNYAPNYLALTIAIPDGGDPVTWLVCRRGRPTPHDLRLRAERRVAVLEEQLRAHEIEPAPEVPSE
jgi:hypothetical protein